MSQTSLRAASRGLLPLALVATFAGACARTASFPVTHPAMLNLSQVGNTVSVEMFQGPFPQAAQDIAIELQNRVVNGLNRSLQLLPQGGGVIVTGVVLDNSWGERIVRTPRTCSRVVPIPGSTSFRTINYGCVDVTRIGTGSARVLYQVLQGNTRQAVFQQTYENSATRQSVGRESPYADENRPPPMLDPYGTLRGLNSGLTDRFSRVILPWQEMVEVTFEDCAGEGRCGEGYDLARNGNLPAAEQKFTEVLGDYQRVEVPVPANRAEMVGEALYNRALVRGFQGRYTQAVSDLARAIALRPNEERFQQMLQNLQALAHDEDALRAQGAVGTTQNVQQAGTP